MSSKIDERIVGMKFNGDQFQKGVADTNRSLEKLKQGLNLNGAAKGLNDLDAAGKNFSLANLANGVQDIASRFGALSVIGITALANIASKAVDVGLTMMRSLTVDPIKAGLQEYELKMGSIQTILSNTARYGTSLEQVTGSLDELNTYADKTIYNFGDMTKNIGLFTNAGLRVEEATSMIKGFSNEAASSGTNAQGAASAAYQLSQALSAGTIRLMDWRSLQNVGMGNKNMQNGLIEIAEAMGQFNDDTTTASAASENFNGSLESNWLSADVMSSYLKIMAGDMDAAAMSAMGLSDAQITSFMAQQKMSEEAATKVRTFTQLIGTMQESVGSGWAQTFDILIGDFNQATDLWTAVNDTLGGMIGKQAEARNKLLQSFVDAGGRDSIIESISNIWKALQNVLTPIQSAFKEIFPPLTAGRLLLLVNTFRDFTATLKPSGEQMALIKRTFMGLFAVLDIGWMIIKGVAGVFGDLFGEATKGAGGILEFTASIGDWLVGVRDALKSGKGLEDFFSGLSDVIKKPFEWLNKLGAAIVDFVHIEDFAEAWERVGEALNAVGEFFAPAIDWIKKAFKEVKRVVGDFFSSLDPNTLIGGLAVAGGGGAALGGGILAKLGIDKLIEFFKNNPLQGIGDSIKKTFGAVTDTFSTMQDSLKAGTLKKIAIAIGIMTAAVIALSFVDTDKLFISLGAMTIMFGQLSGMLMVMDKFMAKFDAGQLAKLSGSMILLAGAMLILSASIVIMGNLEWDELARGLIGMGVGLGALMGAMQLMSGMKKKVAEIAPALITMSIAMLAISVAIKIMSTMSWEEVAKGLGTFSVALGAMVGAMQFLTKGAKGIGVMLALAGGMVLIAGAMKVFASMSWDEILRAMTVFGGAVLILTGALTILSTFGKLAPVGAAVLLAMAVAMNILVPALKAFGDMSWEAIGKAMVVLAGSLAILAGAMALMGIPIVLLGSIGILAASAALMMLAPALVLLGGMSWDDIGRGLTMLAASLAIMAVLGLLMIPASVGFLLLGVAILAIGAGVLMAAQGVAMFALAIGLLAAAAALGSEAIKMALMSMIDLIPVAMAAFAQGIIDFALVIANGGTEFTMAMTTLIQSLMLGIQANAPLVIETIWNLIVMLTEKVVAGVPYFVEAGMRLLIGLLDGINRQLPALMNSATNLIVTFINGIAANLPRIIQAGINLIISFVQGLADGINRNRARMNEAGGNLAMAIIDGMTNGLASGIGKVISQAKRVAEQALNAAKNFLGIKSPSREFFKVGAWSSEGMAIGLEKTAPVVERAAEAVGNGALVAMRKSLDDLKNGVATDMTLNPTIKPVLDLSAVRQGSGLIGGLLTPPTLKVDDSYAYAASIATAQREFEDSRGDDGSDIPPTSQYIFNQTINSPKAISPAEVYRQTNNQLSVVKKGQPNAG